MVLENYKDILTFWFNFEHLPNDVKSVRTHTDLKGVVHSYTNCFSGKGIYENVLSLNDLNTKQLCPECSSSFHFEGHFLETAAKETTLKKCAVLVLEIEEVFKTQEFLTIEKAVKFLHNPPVNHFISSFPQFSNAKVLEKSFETYTAYFNTRLQTLKMEALKFLRSVSSQDKIKTFYMRKTLQNFLLQHLGLFDTESKIYLSFEENLHESVFKDSNLKLIKLKETFTEEFFKTSKEITDGNHLYLLASFYSYAFEKRSIITLPPIIYKACKNYFEEAINIPEEPNFGVLEIMETLFKENESLTFENAYEIAANI